jgi:galactose mutarotase-like enzyme
MNEFLFYALQVRRFTLDNGNGLTVQLINYGATITSIKVGHILKILLICLELYFNKL